MFYGCMVVLGSNFFEHRIRSWFRITKTSCHFGLHIALNAIGLLPCKMILVAKCCHFMCTPWYAMLVSFPLVSFVEKLGNNQKNSSGDNNRLKTQETSQFLTQPLWRISVWTLPPFSVQRVKPLSHVELGIAKALRITVRVRLGLGCRQLAPKQKKNNSFTVRVVISGLFFSDPQLVTEFKMAWVQDERSRQARAKHWLWTCSQCGLQPLTTLRCSWNLTEQTLWEKILLWTVYIFSKTCATQICRQTYPESKSLRPTNLRFT